MTSSVSFLKLSQKSVCRVSIPSFKS